MPESVWRERDFVAYWFGQSVSFAGAQVTRIALPLVALLQLGASPAEVGLLTAANYVPYLFFTLPVGVLVDRVRRRPLMIAADLVRAAVLVLVPLGVLGGWLSLPLLVAIAAVAGACAVVFDVAYATLLPDLVGRDQLPAANGVLEASRSAAGVLGPGLGGLLVQTVRASGAILVDAVSYVVSAVSLALIRTPETRPERGTGVRGLPALLAGARQVARSPLLRPQTLFLTASGLFAGAYGALLVVFLVRGLSLSGLAIGVTLAISNLGFLAGSLLARRLADRVGIGMVLCGAAALEGAGILVVAAAHGAAVVVAGQLVVGVAVASFNVHSLSLRQAVSPPELLGRVSAAVRFLGFGSVPVGAAAGGWLGTVAGLRPTLAGIGVGTVAAGSILLFSAVRRVRTVPPVEPTWAATGVPVLEGSAP